MNTSSPTINRILFAFCGVAFALPCLFFTYYTVRLIWLNMTMENAAAYQSGGMLIGAVAFPAAAIVFGLISRWFIKKSRRGSKEK